MSGSVASRAGGLGAGMHRSESKVTRLHAEKCAQQWQVDGEEARKYGNEVWAAECFAKARYWRDKVSAKTSM